MDWWIVTLWRERERLFLSALSRFMAIQSSMGINRVMKANGEGAVVKRGKSSWGQSMLCDIWYISEGGYVHFNILSCMLLQVVICDANELLPYGFCLDFKIQKKTKNNKKIIEITKDKRWTKTNKINKIKLNLIFSTLCFSTYYPINVESFM